MGIVNLDNTLTEPNQVGTNTNSTAGDLEGKGQEEGQEGRGREGAGRGGAGGEGQGQGQEGSGGEGMTEKDEKQEGHGKRSEAVPG